MMVESWPYIYNFILVVKSKDFVAWAGIFYEAVTVVDVPHVANETIKFDDGMTLAESVEDYLIKITHGSIAYEAADNVMKLLD